MHSKYDDETLRKINDEADLLSYVSDIYELEKSGDNYFAHCPKHIDETPSLCFNAKENYYYCFSCGRAGGMIGYLMDYEGLYFDEAVEKAAKIANLDLSKVCQSETVAFLKRYKAVTEKKKLKYEHPVLSTLEYTRYSKESVKEWEAEGISPEVMDLFGVRVDTEQNKIVYPVYDIDGNLINVKARTRYKNYKILKIPKYINYYPVGVMDYFQGLNITLPYVQNTGEIILFESLKSVMKAYGWGYINCASAEKHTLTTEQEDLLLSLKVNVVFAFDSDVSYSDKDILKSISKLRRLTNVYIIRDDQNLLGGKEAKNAPVDLGRGIWEQLYKARRKVV